MRAGQAGGRCADIRHHQAAAAGSEHQPHPTAVRVAAVDRIAHAFHGHIHDVIDQAETSAAVGVEVGGEG